eukprot:3156369-Amphidinium_carterae.2
MHKDQVFSPGQWVFVWRKVQATHRVHMSHRAGSWRGPGLVILQQGHTAYVSMRSRLWRCNVDQLRSAGSAEMLGAELVQGGQLRDLLLHLHSTRGATAVDCTQDGTPDPDDTEDTVPLDEAAASIVPLGANNQVPPAVSAEQIPLMPMPTIPEHPDTSPAEPRSEPSATPRSSALGQERHTSEATAMEPEPMDDGNSSVATRSRLDSDSRRDEPHERAGKLARTSSRGHASSAVGAEAPAQTSASSSHPWLRLTPTERQSALRELERLPQCLRTPRSSAESPDQQDVEAGTSDSILCDLGSSLAVMGHNVDGGLTRERAKALGEVRLSDLSDDQRKAFEQADAQEWEGIRKVVTIHLGPAAQALRARWPDRIISGRMIRRLKAQPGRIRE